MITTEVRKKLHIEQFKYFKITKRELDIIGLIIEGKSNTEIGVRLCVTVHTVKAHISSILSKLAVSSRTEAAAKVVALTAEGQQENIEHVLTLREIYHMANCNAIKADNPDAWKQIANKAHTALRGVVI